ncbi:MAG: Ig-like domain repeat protein [Bryobacterales bacterium]|nr:Ig-like domain repeat protein [Bryobacterales bacterium]
MNVTLRFGRLAMVLGAGMLAWGQTTFTNSSAISCTVGTGGNPGTSCTSYPSTITVSGLSGTISNLQVRLNNLSVDREQDLIAVLVGPTGSNLVLLSDAGSSITTNTSGVTLTLADSAASAIAQTTTQAFTTGTFRPSGHNTGLATAKDNFPSPAPAQASLAYPAPFGSATLASQFNGINPNGSWSLYLIDDALGPPSGSGGVTGINVAGGWSLIVTAASASAPTATIVTSSANPSFTGGSVTFTASVTSAGNPVTLGTVTFFADNVQLGGAVPLNGSGQASIATSGLAQGVSLIRADYSGATGFGSSSGSLNQEVNNQTVVSGNTFCNTGRIGVFNDLNSPAARPYPAKVFVSGLSGTINNMTLQLKGFNTGRADDAELLLVGPNGAKFVAMNDVGGAIAASNLNLDLDDGAASLLPDETALAAGTFRPTAVNSTAANFPAPAPASPYNFAAPFGASTFAANFNGAAPNGTWQLFLVDDAGGGGTQTSLESGYCLAFTTTSDPATTTTVTSSQNPSFTSAPANSVTFTATVRNAATSAVVSAGSVIFTEGATVLAGPLNLNASGQASFTTTSLTEGVHVITATYSGAIGQFNGSNGSFNQTVDNHTVVSGNQFCNPGPLTIPSSGVAVQYPSRVFVSGLSGATAKVTLTLNNLNGVRPDDLDVLLVGPTGAKLVVLSDAGGSTGSTATTLTLDDDAASAIADAGPVTSGTFRPSSYAPAGDVFPSPAPAGPFAEAAPSGTATFANTFQGSDPNGVWQLFVNDDSLGGPGAFTGGYCLNFTMAADLSLAKTHAGNFSQGQTGAQYSLTVSNLSNANATGAITVVDTLPAGLTATAISGNGWSCTLATLSCTRSDGLSANNQFPPVTLTVNVASNAPALVTNEATVAGGGDLNPSNNTAQDNTVIVQTVAVTVDTVPTGRTFLLDGDTFTAPRTFQLLAGSNHTLATTSPQGGPSTRFVFANWSDGGPISHSIVTPSSPVSLIASFTTQHLLTTEASPANGGVVTPGGFFDAGSSVPVTATANAGFVFASFTGGLTGSANPQNITMNAPATVTANFEATVAYTVTSSPAGRTFVFDGDTYTAPQTFQLVPGSSHVVATTTPQSGTPGTRFQFNTWSDSGAIAHTITVPGSAFTLTANFITQHALTLIALPPTDGTLTPASGQFFNEGASVLVTATAGPGKVFSGFSGDLTGAANPQSVIMSAPRSVTANFGATIGLTIASSPAGRTLLFDGAPFTAPQTFQVTPGSSHTIATTTPQAGPTGTRFAFNNWSDLGAISHIVTAPAADASITASFDTQFQLTTSGSPSGGGTITPATGFFNAGAPVLVTAAANAGFTFSGFSGGLSGSTNPQTITMNAPAAVVANFAEGVPVAPNLTAQVTVTRGAPAFNRATGRFTQTVTVSNPGAAIANPAFVLDSLPAGVALFQSAGVTLATVPAGSPYKEIGSIGGGAAVTFTLEFTRTGTAAITYAPRLLGAGSR